MKKFYSEALDQMLNTRKSSFEKSGLGYIGMGSFIPFTSQSPTGILMYGQSSICQKSQKRIASKTNQVKVNKGKRPIYEVQVIKPKSRPSSRSQNRSKFVPTCYHCGVVGDTRPNCFFLRSRGQEVYYVSYQAKTTIIETPKDKLRSAHLLTNHKILCESFQGRTVANYAHLFFSFID